MSRQRGVVVVLGVLAALAPGCGARTPGPASEVEPEGPPPPPPDAAPNPIRSTLAGIPVGALSGRVSEAVTDRSLDLVRVKAIAPGIREPRVDFTANDGTFFINNVRVLTYDVVFAREGGPELTVTGVEIPQGAAARVCVRLAATTTSIPWDRGAACED